MSRPPVPPPPPSPARDPLLTALFRSGDALRSRSVSAVVLSATLDIPAPPPRLVADWEREIASQLALAPGDVEALPLARARMRWPDYRACVQAMADWTQAQGLPGVLDSADVALMACRGARHHHDGAQYASAAFCNLFVSEDRGLDVVFPFAGRRIALARGTALVFDTGQPHAVVRRGATAFDAADFASGLDCSQLFLTWELPIEEAHVACALGIAFDVDARSAARLHDEQVLVNGAPAVLCPGSGRWLPAG
uniref:hypothetical protein n=1 Tax=unclassified Variovorax TaxID=663243 RepID=UPI000D39A71A